MTAGLRALLALLAAAALALAALGGTAAGGTPPVARVTSVCADYDTQADAQRAADTRDADADGIYCEALPCPCAGPTADAEPDRATSDQERTSCRRTPRAIRVTFSRRRWPAIADHIADVRPRYPLVLHVDRAGTDVNRREATRGIPTRDGYDRDEYPPAMSREGGEGADVRYVRSSENRSGRGACRQPAPALLRPAGIPDARRALAVVAPRRQRAVAPCLTHAVVLRTADMI